MQPFNGCNGTFLALEFPYLYDHLAILNYSIDRNDQIIYV